MNNNNINTHTTTSFPLKELQAELSYHQQLSSQLHQYLRNENGQVLEGVMEAHCEKLEDAQEWLSESLSGADQKQIVKTHRAQASLVQQADAGMHSVIQNLHRLTGRVQAGIREKRFKKEHSTAKLLSNIQRVLQNDLSRLTYFMN